MTVRELRGWAPGTVTFDADGSLLSYAVQEPRFTPPEVELLMAARRSEMRPRGGHGVLMEEAVDPSNVDAFTVPPPLTDFAEKAMSEAQKKYKQRWGEEALENTIWRVEMKRSALPHAGEDHHEYAETERQKPADQQYQDEREQTAS